MRIGLRSSRSCDSGDSSLAQRLEVGDERGAVGGPAGRIADRVELQLEGADPERSGTTPPAARSPRHRRRDRPTRSPRRRTASARGSGRAAARAYRNIGAKYQSLTGCGSRASPCSMYARTTGAVPSGRSVSERSLRSWNVYISLETTSEVSPAVRANRLVSSKSGVTIWRKPARSNASIAVSTTCWRSATRGGSQSSVPRGRSMCSLIGERREKRVRRPLTRDRRIGPVAGEHRRLGREGLDEHAQRAIEHRGIGALDVGASDTPCEQHISGEQNVLDEVRDVRRRVSGNGQNTHRERPDLAAPRPPRAATSGGAESRSACAQTACILGRLSLLPLKPLHRRGRRGRA